MYLLLQEKETYREKDEREHNNSNIVKENNVLALLFIELQSDGDVGYTEAKIMPGERQKLVLQVDYFKAINILEVSRPKER